VFKQSIKAISLVLIVLLLVPAFSYSECSEHSKNEANSHFDISRQSKDELYLLYIENVEMNNPYLHKMNHLGHNNGSGNTGMYLTDFNLTDLELLERAQEESYRLFKIWLSDEDCQKEFIAKMNDRHSNQSVQLASKNIK